MKFVITGEASQVLFDIGLPVQESGVYVVDPTSENLQSQLLPYARLHCISADELYFLQSSQDVTAPFNLRNEAAAVSLLLQQLNNKEPTTEDVDTLRRELYRHCETLWPQFASGETVITATGTEATKTFRTNSGDSNENNNDTNRSPEAAFHQWAQEHGIKAAIEIAEFGELRGCAALHNIEPGEPILSIPQAALIYEDTIKTTDLGRMLLAIPNVTVDNILILFAMIDRQFDDSIWTPFWHSLPSAFKTGLSFPPQVLSTLQGTAAFLEIQRGQDHLRRQYELTRPLMDMLLKAYPQFLEASWFEYAKYVWAAELFYSYAFEIEFPPSKTSQTVMVPFACHVNHSPWPHCVRYGKLDETTKTLDYPAFRPCLKGHQVFISYGPVPNLKLLGYYGFVIEENPHDVVAIKLEPPNDGILSPIQDRILKKYKLTLDHSLQKGPFALKLLATLRIIVATNEELLLLEEKGGDRVLGGMLNTENEKQALEVLEGALKSIRGQLPNVEDMAVVAELFGAENSSGEAAFDIKEWRGSLESCRMYVRGQIDILEHCLSECARLIGQLLL